MAHKLPPLPYALDALAPHISEETLEYHYGKHHQGYVDKLNDAVKGSEYENMPLEDVIVATGEGDIFNNAAQVWNHTFYWNGLSPKGGGDPKGDLEKAISKAFGSTSDFKDKFDEAVTSLFGSGWAWLVKDANGKLSIMQTENAGNPLGSEYQPLLTCDTWEHAFYIDYRNDKSEYLEAFWAVVNWDFAGENLQA